VPAGFGQVGLELWLRDSYCTRTLTCPKQTEAVHPRPKRFGERADSKPSVLPKAWLRQHGEWTASKSPNGYCALTSIG
jgi:hypothetical protein